MTVAAQLADADGLRGVGIRAIAARLRISPGTIYNTVGDTDDIILLVNQETLMRLRDATRRDAERLRGARATEAVVGEAGDRQQRGAYVLVDVLLSRFVASFRSPKEKLPASGRRNRTARRSRPEPYR